MFTHLPGQQPVALAFAIDDVRKRDWFLSREGLPEWLNEDLDLAAARQADIERHLVADAVRHQPGVVLFEDLLGVLDDIVFDAAARDGSDELAILGDRHLRA